MRARIVKMMIARSTTIKMTMMTITVIPKLLPAGLGVLAVCKTNGKVNGCQRSEFISHINEH